MEERGEMAAWGQAEHWVLPDEQLLCASLAFYTLLLILLLLLFLLSLCYPVKLSLSQLMRFYLFSSDSPPHPSGDEGRSKQLHGA